MYLFLHLFPAVLTFAGIHVFKDQKTAGPLAMQTGQPGSCHATDQQLKQKLHHGEQVMEACRVSEVSQTICTFKFNSTLSYLWSFIQDLLANVLVLLQ